MRIHAINMLILFATVALMSMPCVSGEESRSKVYVKAYGGHWPTEMLLAMADIYGVPVAVESSDFDAYHRHRSQGVLVSLPFVATDPGAGIQLLLDQVKAVTKADDYKTD